MMGMINPPSAVRAFLIAFIALHGIEIVNECESDATEQSCSG